MENYVCALFSDIAGTDSPYSNDAHILGQIAKPRNSIAAFQHVSSDFIFSKRSKPIVRSKFLQNILLTAEKNQGSLHQITLAGFSKKK